jgi:hypothetical protein
MNKCNKRIFVVSSIVCASSMSACYAGENDQQGDVEMGFARSACQGDIFPITPSDQSSELLQTQGHTLRDEENVDPESGDALAVVVEVPENNGDNYFFVNRVIAQAIGGADRIYHSYTMQNLVLPLIVTSVGGFIGFKVFAS